MVELDRITQPECKEFPELMLLYESAFPFEERREVTALEKLVRNEDRMYFNAIRHDGELAGLFIYWDFGDFYYLEHLAVYDAMRNHKIGTQVLSWAETHLDGLRILEAEPAVEELPTRRIRYYERNGYKVCDRSYHQPSYHRDGEGIGLWVLCSREDSKLPEYLTRMKAKVYAK